MKPDRGGLGGRAAPYLFILPVFLLYLAFNLGPVLINVVFSFFRWDSFLPTTDFVGLKNFRHIFSDAVFWRALCNNLIFLVLAVAVPVGLGLFLAALIANVKRGRAVYRTLIFLPCILSGSVVAYVWKWIYHPFVGILNNLLDVVGLGVLKTSWLGDTRVVLLACFVAYAWSSVGFSTVIYLSGIQGLDASCYEAAELEGIGFFGRLRRITAPMLRETTTFVVSLRILSAMGIFEVIYNMTSGGPYYASNVISIYTYNMLNNMEMGWGTAAATVNAVIVVAMSVGYNRWRERREL